jgi:putative nucleotidyltransferase with HDIG domain
MAAVNRDPPQVLIVDDEQPVRKMLATILQEGDIPCRQASSAEEALALIKSGSFHAVLSDLQMTGMSGLDLLDQVRRDHPFLAFLMVTGVDQVDVAIEAIQRGADDYLVKPLQIDIVLFSLRRALEKKQLEMEVSNYRLHLEQMVVERTAQVQQALRQIEQSYDDTLRTLGEAIDLRDTETAGHSYRVCQISARVLTSIGGTEAQHRSVVTGALLHDIGKLGIPDAILLKPGALNDEERRIMQQHVQIGYDLVKRISSIAEAADIVLMHHERCDGSGYPNGLTGAEIHLGAKIFAVADTVDAMTSNRPYRAALPFRVAREQIERGSGTLYDAEVASAFLELPGEIWESIRRESTAKFSTYKAIRPITRWV